MPICEQCGNQLPDGEHFCTVCGTVSDPNRQHMRPDAAPCPAKGSPYAVLGSWSFVGTILLMCIPVVGFILMIVWACGGTFNHNRRNLARAYLLIAAIIVILYLILVVVVGLNASSINEIVSF